jgi:hypothetical protein
MTVRDYALAFWKTFVVGATGAIVLWLANRGIKLPPGWDGLLESLLLGLGLAAYNHVVNWLQARRGTGFLPELARWVGRLLTLGVPALPNYSTPVPPQVGKRG